MSDDLLSVAWEARRAVQDQAPLVQCLTNRVVPQVTAYVLLAAGASPAMVDTPQEAAQFAAVASAVLVNVGTVDESTATAMRAAVAAARGPWVLDPVAVGGLEFRTRLALSLLESGPRVVRGNASEIRVLAGSGSGGRGVDTTDDVETAAAAARGLSRRTGAVVAVSGPVDLVVAPDGRTARVHAGHPVMTRVVGTGCALGALVAAYTAVLDDAFEATVAAHVHTGAAGGMAAEATTAPGSFAVAWLDALHTLDDATMRAHCCLETSVGAV